MYVETIYKSLMTYSEISVDFCDFICILLVLLHSNSWDMA